MIRCRSRLGGAKPEPARTGSGDPRRLILPLDTRQWERGQTIQVEVQRNRLELRTAPKPLPVD